MRRKVTESDYERFKRFRRFMEEIPNSDSIVPKDCGSCGCFQPYWKYRTCLYAKCKYNKPINVFRNKPLNVDVIIRLRLRQIISDYLKIRWKDTIICI